MPRNILESIFEHHIERFRAAFVSTSREIYYDDEKERLRHPGEFGAYREQLVHDFLKLFVPSHLSLGSGFVVNSVGSVSTQCDLIIYDPAATPLIEDDKSQRFFPCESVVGIGEVKSVLSKQQLTEALRKLAAAQVIRRTVKAPAYIFPSGFRGESYSPLRRHQDTPITFLICEKIEARIEEMPVLFDTIYSEIDCSLLKHNLLLDISSAAYHYYDRDAQHHIWYPSIEGKEFEPSLTVDESNNEHFKVFCSFLNNGLGSTFVLSPELHTYLESIQAKVFTDYNN